jgi:monofunctional biosynthetic peptidoglycan transglycosylase
VAKSKKKRWVLRWVIRFVAAVLIAGAVALGYQVITWPDVAELATHNPRTTAFIERARDQGVHVQWRWVDYDHISLELKRAVVVAEDISFFWHNGIDTQELKVAAREAITGKRLRGASTITQQLAKNLWLSQSRSPLRKLKELILTRQLEEHLGKRRILELYLNVVEFGSGVYGADAAAGHYFGISAADLDERRAAQLAASLPRPATWHPGVESRGYHRYVNEIRARMEQADWLDRRL